MLSTSLYHPYSFFGILLQADYTPYSSLIKIIITSFIWSAQKRTLKCVDHHAVALLVSILGTERVRLDLYLLILLVLFKSSQRLPWNYVVTTPILSPDLFEPLIGSGSSIQILKVFVLAEVVELAADCIVVVDVEFLDYIEAI